MDWWTQFSAQFWGSLLASLIVVPAALFAEAVLDEWRDRRHERKAWREKMKRSR